MAMPGTEVSDFSSLRLVGTLWSTGSAEPFKFLQCMNLEASSSDTVYIIAIIFVYTISGAVQLPWSYLSCSFALPILKRVQMPWLCL